MTEDMVAKFLYSPVIKEKKRPEKTERRKQLEAKILDIFKESVDGISKYNIQRKLILYDKDLAISINTVKRIVDEFVANGIVECVNPNDSTNLKFRLVEVKDD